jgi:hypothetical protein
MQTVCFSQSLSIEEEDFKNRNIGEGGASEERYISVEFPKGVNVLM